MKFVSGFSPDSFCYVYCSKGKHPDIITTGNGVGLILVNRILCRKAKLNIVSGISPDSFCYVYCSKGNRPDITTGNGDE